MAMSPSTFSEGKRYEVVNFHQDRVLLDSELNELQDIFWTSVKRFLNVMFGRAAIVTPGTSTANVSTRTVTFSGWGFYFDGHGLYGLTTDVVIPAGTSANLPIYLEVCKRVVTATDDTALVDPDTGQPTAERQRWEVALKTTDTTNDPLPTGVTFRFVAPAFTVDQNTFVVTKTMFSIPTADDFNRMRSATGIQIFQSLPNASDFTVGEQIILRETNTPDRILWVLLDNKGTKCWAESVTGFFDGTVNA